MKQNSPTLWADKIPRPTSESHKYTRGNLCIIGGEMPGAVRLAARAARRTGVGILKILVPEKNREIVASDWPGNIVEAWHKKGDILEHIQNPSYDAFLIGPGFGKGELLKELVFAILERNVPTLLDADALTVWKNSPETFFENLHSKALLTPHEGEFASLFGEIKNREEDTLSAAKKASCSIILKGSESLITCENGELYKQDTATPYLATAGTGDVLAGIAASLLAQGMEPLDAACAAVWLHSAAARACTKPLIAEDVIEEIPAVLNKLSP